MGQGRNSVFLASSGWDVTGFDVSDEGLAIARSNAQRAGVRLTAIQSTNEAFEMGKERWDLLVFMYEPFPITSARYLERMRASMKPGAIIVIESFAAEDNTPNQAATAIHPKRLLAACSEFKILYFQDTSAQPDWGAGPKRLVRMIAEREG
jgi:2-polyprenyl-3-methyl-5-hydroxy-6-metoxy-1,4-benzoquinol methylase